MWFPDRGKRWRFTWESGCRAPLLYSRGSVRGRADAVVRNTAVESGGANAVARIWWCGAGRTAPGQSWFALISFTRLATNVFASPNNISVLSM